MKDTTIIKAFLLKECTLAHNPNDFYDTYRFANSDELIETLLSLLLYNLDDDNLKEAGNKILSAINMFSSNILEVDKLNDGLEKLSTGFESLLKIIAILKYGETKPTVINGDGLNYLGYINSPLGKLLEGEVAKSNRFNKLIPPLKAPLVTFSYTSPYIRDVTYNFVRNLRNEIHLAPAKGLDKILIEFKNCIAAYLFAIEENIIPIRPKIDPVFNYMQIAERDFHQLSDYFVDLDSESTLEINKLELPSLDALEWLNDLTIKKGPINDEYKDTLVAKTPITEIFENKKRFWLIGEPGSGKTTSFQIGVLRGVQKILNTGKIDEERIPIYIPARLINETYSIKKFIRHSLKINDNILDLLLIQDKVKIILDGINEMSESLQLIVQSEIQNLINEYEELAIAISSRRYGFTRVLNFPVYELLPLSVTQIEIYIKQYIKVPQEAEALIQQLRQADDLIIDFAKNPLLLRMLIQVGIKEQIQPNFGLLFDKFIHWILEREKKKGEQINELLKVRTLSELAFRMRNVSTRVIEQDQLLTIINETLSRWHETVGAVKFLDEALSNRILVKNSSNQISFFHELVQEYFTAIKLKDVFRNNPSSIGEIGVKSEWFESLIILSGLLTDPDELISLINDVNPVLAARCVSSGSKASQSLIFKICGECDKKLELDKSENEPITTLLELSTIDSFRLVVRHLALRRLSFTSALSRCQRPEIIALKLLNFGLTGKHRIRQCLKVFIGKPKTLSFINSKTIADAQIILTSGKIEIEDITIIDKLGVSDLAKSRVASRISEIVTSMDYDSKLFIRAVEFVGTQRKLFNDEIIAFIEPKVKSLVDSSDTGGQLFLSFRIARSISRVTDIVLIIEQLINKIYQKKFYNLLLLYFKEFGNIVDTNKYLSIILPDLVKQGKLNIILDYCDYFENCINDDDKVLAFRNRLKKGLILEVLLFVSKIRHLLNEEDLKLLSREMLINKNSINLSSSNYFKWINKLELSDYFENIAIITRLTKTQSGFARNLITGDMYYFKIPKRLQAVENFKLGNFIKIKTIDFNPIVDNKEIRNIRPRILTFDLV